MEGLVALVIIVFLPIQIVAGLSITFTLLGGKWIGFGLAISSLIAGVYTGRLRYEGMVFWFLPLVAIVFWLWKYVFARWIGV